ncbi:MAG: CYTH domain-containing protein [Gammaproteobacteria bacterium]|jgi:CYTH domain-containing protein
MAREIERKFLVTTREWQSGDAQEYRQGYLNLDKERTVRVRIAGEAAYLTIKGITQGATRREFEYAIPLADARELLTNLCHKPLIEKRRHKVRHGGLTWEVDEFFGDNAGLVVAEVELEDEDQPFERPPWLGEEVTDDPRYYNASLVDNPYRNW